MDNKFCLPIEKKPMCCGDCEYQKRYECVITGKALKELLQISADCPIIPMPDVEALKAERDLYKGLIEKFLSDDCSPPDITCSDADCDECWRVYLESKLSESEAG